MVPGPRRERPATSARWPSRRRGALEDEARRPAYRIAELEAPRALKNRTEEAEAYVAAVKASLPWRIIQWLRGLVGRKW